jgi:hypothetical protein
MPFTWWSVVPTLVGAGISLFTTVVMFSVARFLDRREKLSTSRKKSALDAFLAFDKLQRAAAITINLSNTIDDEYREAHARGIDESREPHEFVRSLVFASDTPINIEISECLFLAKGNNLEFFAEICTFLRRVRTTEALVLQFNLEKQRFHDFLESLPHAVEGNTAVSTTYGLAGDDAKKAIPRVGRLNNILGMLIEGLEADKTTAKSLVEKYHKIAAVEFTTNWRVKSIAWKG